MENPRELQVEGTPSTDLDAVVSPLTTTLVVGANADTHLLQRQPTSNFGGALTVVVDGDTGSGLDASALLGFDLSGVPAGATLAQAALRLNITESSSQPYEVYALRRAWTWNQATWRQSTSGAPWEVAGAQGVTDREPQVLGTLTPSSVGLRDFSLTAAGVSRLRTALASPSTFRGLIIADPVNRDGFTFDATGAAVVSRRPALVLTYSLPDTTAPETTITSGPTGTVTTASVTFAFSSSEAGSTFECALDGAAFTPCQSPKTYEQLAFSAHTFVVRAIDPSGNVDPTPAGRSWTQQQDGSGRVLTVGAGMQFTTIQACLDVAQAGDTCLTQPGTFAPARFIRSGNATLGPVTLKASTPVWTCAHYDRGSAPYSSHCTRSPTGLSTISGPGNCLSIVGVSNVRIEGFDLRCSGSGVLVDSSAGTADNVELAFSHFQGGSPSTDLSLNSFQDVDANGWAVRAHHLSFYEPASDGTGGAATDYAIALYKGSHVELHNVWCGTAYNHCISLKRYVRHAKLDFVHVEGSYDGVYVGQNADDPNTFGGPACSSDRDHTSGDARIRWLFVRGTDDPNGALPNPGQPLRVHNAYDVTVENLFVAHATRGVYAAKDPTASLSTENGLCGAKGEDLSILCALFVRPQTDVLQLFTKGLEDDTVTLQRFVSYAPGARHFNFRSGDDFSSSPASCLRQETCSHPYADWRLGIFVNGSGVADAEEIASRTRDLDNNYFGVPSRGQVGDTQLDPQLKGPLAVPRGTGIPTLEWAAIASWAQGFTTTNVTLAAQGKGINGCFVLGQ